MSVKIGIACRNLVMIALVAGAQCACGHPPPVDSNSGSAVGGASLNRVSAQQVIGAVDKAGLPALNPHDVTAEQCPNVHCNQAVSTDTVSVYKFAITGLAQKYAGSIPNAFQIEDIVVVFAPSVGADLKQDYEAVVARTAA